MAPSGAENRRHPRFRFALRVHLALPGRTLTTTTTGVSRSGMSVRLLNPLPDIDSQIPVTLELPNGTSIDGIAQCRTHNPGGLCGLSLSFSGDAELYWESFIDEEEHTGGLWRMIGRMAKAPDDALAPRGYEERVDRDDLRFHTVGENGEAYRIAFERHPSDLGEDSDLAASLPGFREQARRLVNRVLREPMHVRMDDKSKVIVVRVAELQRGGFAYVQGDAETPTGLVSLVVGELVLVQKNGKSVFPHYTDSDLERIACDTFRSDLTRPVFSKMRTPTPASTGPAPVALPPIPAPPSSAPKGMPQRFKEGVDAVRFAQAAADDVQMRKYGDREIWFHPSVWARVVVDDNELMGPTLQDSGNICVLALIGPGAPRVVKLTPQSKVSVLKPPK